MKFRLYAARHAWLLFPECMQASLDAARRHGPLEFIREIDEQALDPEVVAALIEEIDARTFAVWPKRPRVRIGRPGQRTEPGETA